MLKALYDYAKRHRLVLPPGYVKKTIKAYVSLSSWSEDFVEVEMGGEEEVLCPDIGSLANGKDKCNVLVEKRSVVFADTVTAKNQFFWDAVRAAGEWEPAMKVCIPVWEKPEIAKKVRKKLDEHKIKPGDRIAFKINGKAFLSSEKIQDWWQEFRQQFLKETESPEPICLITGQPIVPVKTTSSINGLRPVGGHASGDALICFDKPAFCSYGLKKAENAPVSEEAFSAVKAALDDLLKEAPVLAGMKFVHWYDREVKREEDPILLSEDFGFFMGEEEDEDEPADEEMEQAEITAKKHADRLIRSVNLNEKPVLPDATYYILLLSGVNGRVMIRRYEHGKYEELYNNLVMWRQDLILTNGNESAPLRECKLSARFIRLLKYKKPDPEIWKRINKELSGIAPAILIAILTGNRLPDTVAERALRYIRSQMLSSAEAGTEDSQKTEVPDGLACQWLKVWLIRKKRAEGKEEFLMENYNLEHPNPAYHCGGLMAVYAAIQQRAMENVNAGVLQRYYASASRTPALVLGRLARLCNYHLSKLEKTRYFEDCLAELYSALADRIPVTLDLEEQSYFALGYYQKWAQLHSPREKTEMKRADEVESTEEG